MATTNLTDLLKRLREYGELSIEEARTLDPGHYTSPELFELEIEHIWKKEWILVGHVCELKQPGDFMAFDLVGEPMLVVRGEDMKLRAVSTICRHRFMPVVRAGERGNAQKFQCPYHRWSYGLDGGLEKALFMEDNKGFAAADVRLPEYRLEIWNDLIWVNLDAEAEPFAPRVADIEERLSCYKVPDDWVSANQYDRVWRANWKLCVENNENYHSFGVHTDTVNVTTPTTNGQRPADYGDYWAVQTWTNSTETEAAKKLLKATDWKPGDMGQQVPALDIGVIFPANGLTWGPGAPGWFTHWPISIRETRAWQGIATHPDRTEQCDDPRDSYLHRVINQDYSAFEAGLGQAVYSDIAQPGFLSWQEEVVLRSHQWTARRILEAVG